MGLNRAAPQQMDIAVIPYKSSRGGRGYGGKKVRDTSGWEGQHEQVKEERKEGRLLQASTVSQLLVRPPNTTLEGNRHVEDIRQHSGT